MLLINDSRFIKVSIIDQLHQLSTFGKHKTLLINH